MRDRALAIAAVAALTAAMVERNLPPAASPKSELKITSKRPGHLYLTDEAVSLSVDGIADGAKISIEKTDPAGREEGKQVVTVNGGAVSLGKLEAGWHHLSATADGASDTVDIAVARPRQKQSFRDDSPFGVVSLPATENEWPLLADMGCAWVQWSMTWAYHETQPRVYWFDSRAPRAYSGREEIVRTSNRYGIRTVLQFRSTPLWASKGRIGSYKGPEQARTVMYPPDDDHWDDYEKFVGQVVDRFKPLGVHHYEVWSEADGSLFKGWETPPFPKVEAYQKLLKHTKNAVKANDPEGRVLANGDVSIRMLKNAEEGYTAPSTFARKPDEYAGSNLPGVGKTVDIVSSHPYWTDFASRPRSHYGPEERNPGHQPSMLKETIQDSNEFARGRPQWITEVGYGSAKSGETPDNVASTEDGQASLLVRYFLLSRSWGARKTFWYIWKDRATGNDLASSYGLLRADGTVKPAYLAYRTLTEKMEGLDWTIHEGGPDRWIIFGTGPRTVGVVWRLKAGNKPDTLTLPYKMVRVTRRDGETYVVKPVNGKIQVQLRSGEPVYLDEAP
jgi:hypothetical protein